MSNFETLTPIVAGVPGTAPTLFSASTADNLATITTAGYLNSISHLFKPNDRIYINYSDTSTFPFNTGLNATFGVFTVVYSAPNFSLVVTADSGALLAANNLSDLNSAATSRTNLGVGTGGTKAASDNTKANVASVSGTPVTGNVAKFADTAGTVIDGGFAVRAQTAANAGGNASQTITDAFCTAGSVVVANWATSANAVSVQKVTPGAGTFVVLSSGDAGAGTLSYIIIKPAV